MNYMDILKKLNFEEKPSFASLRVVAFVSFTRNL